MASGESIPLSIDACRRILGRTADSLSNGEVERVRDQLYALAHIAVTACEAAVACGSESLLERLPTTARESIEERAAVLEFDAGMTRTAATRRAFASHFHGTGRPK